MNAPECVETDRLILRRPLRRDADAIFAGYASDPEATRYLGWRRHRSVQDTLHFLDFSASEWTHSPGGPYLIEVRASGQVIGSTGFAFETEYRASTGYVLSRGSWGRGYASEALRGIVGVSAAAGIVRLQAQCHVDHDVSARVLEKCGFVREGILQRYSEFPNLDGGGLCDVISYSRIVAG
jgi:RimJ/RimL family protein N-acetyltransferase